MSFDPNQPVIRPNAKLEAIAEQQLEALHSLNAKIADLSAEVKLLSRIVEDYTGKQG